VNVEMDGIVQIDLFADLDDDIVRANGSGCSRPIGQICGADTIL
jgi:hypothetical protein